MRAKLDRTAKTADRNVCPTLHLARYGQGERQEDNVRSQNEKQDNPVGSRFLQRNRVGPGMKEESSRTPAASPESAISTPGTVRVLIVDDHPAVRQGLALLLEPEGVAVCAEAGNSAEALARVEELRPDVVLVDLSLGEEDGSLLVAELTRRAVPTLVYSMHEDGRRVESAFAAGARGYVTKREVHRVLVEAIGAVAAGRRFVSPRAAVALADRVVDARADAACDGLSSQERQVYRFLGEGQGTTEIAAAMGISTRTVESYYARMLVKLGLGGMRELRHEAIVRRREDTA